MKLSDLKSKLKQQQSLLQKYHVSGVRAFGSVVRDEATPTSDVDLLVSFSQSITLFQLLRLKGELSEALGCPVDLVTEDALHPALADKILKECVDAA